MKTYICINLNDFHSNQDGGETKAAMKIVRSKNVEDCKRYLNKYYPDFAFSIVSKETFDSNIAYKPEKKYSDESANEPVNGLSEAFEATKDEFWNVCKELSYAK